jgi:hypothetical protein
MKATKIRSDTIAKGGKGVVSNSLEHFMAAVPPVTSAAVRLLNKHLASTISPSSYAKIIGMVSITKTISSMRTYTLHQEHNYPRDQSPVDPSKITLSHAARR